MRLAALEMIQALTHSAILQEALADHIAIGAAVHATGQDETLKNIYAGYAYQYDQAAAWRSLAVVAERAGQSDEVGGFRTTVEEKIGAAEEIAGLIEPVTKTYLDLTLNGSKADS